MAGDQMPDRFRAEGCLRLEGAFDEDQAAAVKIFAFFDEVEPEGGGTLVLEGSHRLVERFARTVLEGRTPTPADEDRFMSHYRWLEQLRCAGTMQNSRRLLGGWHEVDGIPLRVTELTGRPGDVVITHMHVLHAPAPNTENSSRQMLGLEVRSASHTVRQRAALSVGLPLYTRNGDEFSALDELVEVVVV